MRNRPFHPSRGGHAPGYLLDDFDQSLRCYIELSAGQPQEGVLDPQLQRITGKLWNCTNDLPCTVRATFGDLLGTQDKLPTTYGQGARVLRRHIGRIDQERRAKLRKARLQLMASKRHLYVEGYASKPRVRVKAFGRIVA